MTTIDSLVSHIQIYSPLSIATDFHYFSLFYQNFISAEHEYLEDKISI